MLTLEIFKKRIRYKFSQAIRLLKFNCFSCSQCLRKHQNFTNSKISLEQALKFERNVNMLISFSNQNVNIKILIFDFLMRTALTALKNISNLMPKMPFLAHCRL